MVNVARAALALAPRVALLFSRIKWQEFFIFGLTWIYSGRP
jgi:hypothetical protein